MLPARGTRPADAADVIALLRGNVVIKDVQRYLLAFLVLDGTGEAPPPTSASGPVPPAYYAALRLWLDLSGRPGPGERRPLDGAVPRGIATGTVNAVRTAGRAALRRLRIAGLPGGGPEDARPNGKSVALPEVKLTSREARLMAAAVLVPVRPESVSRLADTLLVSSAPREPHQQPQLETAHV